VPTTVAAPARAEAAKHGHSAQMRPDRSNHHIAAVAPDGTQP